MQRTSTQMPGLAEWLTWLDSDDPRFRDQAVKALSARHLETVLAERVERHYPGLTPHGMAYTAAAMAIVLTDPNHSERERIVRRFRAELAAAA